MKKSAKKQNQQKNKIKLSKFQKIIISSVLAFILLGILGFIILSAYNWKPTVAFYGINSKTQNGIIEVLQKTQIRKRGGKNVWPYNIEILDSNYSLEKSLTQPATFISEQKDKTGKRISKISKAKKPELIITLRGKNADFVIDNIKNSNFGLDDKILSEMTTSTKETAVYDLNKKVISVPLLNDNIELCVNKNALDSFFQKKYKTYNRSNFISLKEFEEFLINSKNSSILSPIVSDFTNSYNFINFFGSLVESLDGIDKLKSASEKIWKVSNSSTVSYNSYLNLLKELTSEGGEFYSAVNLLKSWQSENLFINTIKDFSEKDFKAFMSADLTLSVFMTLSQHRTIEHKTIKNYSSVYIPSQKMERTFSSPEVVAIPYSNNKKIKESVKLLATEFQPELCAKTMLAPVNSTCSTVDIQSNDLRYWIAASNIPFEGLSESAFKTLNSRNQFVDALKSFLN